MKEQIRQLLEARIFEVKNLNTAIYAASALLAISVFLPLIELPAYGEVTYNRVAPVESYLVIILAISAVTILLLKKLKLLYFSPAGVWLVLLFPAIQGLFEKKKENILTEVGDAAVGVFQDFAADLFLNIFNFHWGGFVFLISLLAFTASCIIRAIKQ